MLTLFHCYNNKAQGDNQQHYLNAYMTGMMKYNHDIYRMDIHYQ